MYAASGVKGCRTDQIGRLEGTSSALGHRCNIMLGHAEWIRDKSKRWFRGSLSSSNLADFAWFAIVPWAISPEHCPPERSNELVCYK